MNFKGHKFVYVIANNIYTHYSWETFECQICKCIIITLRESYIFANGTLGKTNTANPKNIRHIKNEMSCDEYIIKNIIE